ncbi:MAG: hypothetical protein U5O39_13925 [Gammaproteobacteria bacterium]|nr:hypothetical protein [Gammaproteobacteria bacterium]
MPARKAIKTASRSSSVTGMQAGFPSLALQWRTSRNAANVDLDGAEGVLIGEEGKGAEVLDKMLDVGRILLACEMLGSSLECFEPHQRIPEDP